MTVGSYVQLAKTSPPARGREETLTIRAQGLMGRDQGICEMSTELTGPNNYYEKTFYRTKTLWCESPSDRMIRKKMIKSSRYEIGGDA
jgi:hypothetical protein